MGEWLLQQKFYVLFKLFYIFFWLLSSFLAFLLPYYPIFHLVENYLHIFCPLHYWIHQPKFFKITSVLKTPETASQSWSGLFSHQISVSYTIPTGYSPFSSNIPKLKWINWLRIIFVFCAELSRTPSLPFGKTESVTLFYYTLHFKTNVYFLPASGISLFLTTRQGHRISSHGVLPLTAFYLHSSYFSC